MGAATFGRLLREYHRLAELFSGRSPGSSVTDLPEATRLYLRQPDWLAVDRDLEWASRPGNRIITCLDGAYPALLKTIVNPPPLLFVVGNPERLGDLQVAVVGSRNPSRTGEQTAQAFSRHLACKGLTITSGLAMGIDTAAHAGALDAGGRTLAVLGTGPDRVYPAANRELARRIADTGALVTELPPETPPLAENFPAATG